MPPKRLHDCSLKPGAIKVDKGGEFIGELMDRWAMRTVCSGFLPARNSGGQLDGGELQRIASAGTSERALGIV